MSAPPRPASLHDYGIASVLRNLHAGVREALRRSVSPPCTGHHHVDITAAALRADQPGAPLWDSRLRTKPPSLVSRVGLAPMSACIAPDHKPEASRRGAA